MGFNTGLKNPDFDLLAYLKTERARIDRALAEIVDLHDDAAPRILKAMQHSLMAGGKRLRPILCLSSCAAVGGIRERVLPAACALEMIHTYSLIHDDLPAMDDDRLRRGKPTCHVAFDEATAILAGDALLTMAFEVLSSASVSDGEDCVARLEIIRSISRAAGPRGMIEGQMRDMLYEGRDIDEKQLEALHRLKTGALIRASIHAGALLGGCGPVEMKKLLNYADRIGLAFQVADDILNVEGDPVLMGKSVGTDSQRRKGTYPALLGLKKAKKLARELVQSALKSLSEFDKRADPLRAIAVYVIERKR